MPRGTADNKAGRLELEPDLPRHDPARDLRGRLAELAASHPSAAGYGADRIAERRLSSVPERAAPAGAGNEGPERQRPQSDSTAATAPDYAAPGDIRLTDERRTHLLDGDQRGGGGHRHGTGERGKTEFPADWADDRIVDAVLAVAREPEQTPERQSWNERWRVSGRHDGVQIVAIVESGGQIWTAWPREDSPGVVRNPMEET